MIFVLYPLPQGEGRVRAKYEHIFVAPFSINSSFLPQGWRGNGGLCVLCYSGDLVHLCAGGRYFGEICHGNISNASGLDFSIIHQGRDIQTITIGKMPNRQITIYNKRREIMVTKKSYWWDLWQLNPDAIKFDIWRVEVRAGKKELNKWNLRRFRDFENKAGDVIIRVLKDYRYIIPSEKDKNRNRWPCEPFWKECISSAQNYLVEYICNAERREIISGQKKEIIKRYKAHINGVLTSYAALQGLDISEIPTVLEGVNGDVIDAIRKNPQKFQNYFNKAEMKFEFINGKTI
jgi:hypothetical protein